MRLAALMILGLMAAAPARAQIRHNYDAMEQRRLDQIAEQEADNRRLAVARPPARPPTAAEKDAAKWRADHLTCASPKGRTRAQFEAECKAAGPS